MKIHEVVHDMLVRHKSKVELFQWAIMSSIGSLIYSEYLKNIKQKQHPVKMFLVPTIRSVQELLMMDGKMFTLLSELLVDEMVRTEQFLKYELAPEFEIFINENLEITKTLFEIYILPNVNRRLPETIARKFDLFNPDNQVVRENREIDLFDRKPFSPDQYQYILRETILNLLTLAPSIMKEIEYPESNGTIYLTDDEIFTVSHENAITPIHFDKTIFELEVMPLLSFVTNSIFIPNDWSVRPISKSYDNDDSHIPISYEVSTGIFNTTSITRLKGINFHLGESN